MKIAFCLGHLYTESIGGAEIQSANLIEHFIKNGHKIIYLSYGSKNNLEPEYFEKNFSIYRIKKPYMGIKTFEYLNKKHIYKILDKERPDIIYQRGDFHFADIISVYGKIRETPVISGISMERHVHPEKIELNKMILISLVNRILKKRYFKYSTRIISQTKEQKKKLKINLGYESEIFPNAHPIPKGPFAKNNPPKIIWVANIKPIKKPEMFIDLAKRFQNKKIDFIMIGRSDKGKYQNKINNLILDIPNLIYKGELSLEETNKEISSSYLLINTSESEGFSNTFIQAWMRETPVISMNSDPGGIITSNRIGFITPDIDELFKKVKYLIENPNEGLNMGKLARRISIQKFSIEKIGDQYLELFESLIKKR